MIETFCFVSAPSSSSARLLIQARERQRVTPATRETETEGDRVREEESE